MTLSKNARPARILSFILNSSASPVIFWEIRPRPVGVGVGVRWEGLPVSPWGGLGLLLSYFPGVLELVESVLLVSQLALPHHLYETWPSQMSQHHQYQRIRRKRYRY